MTIMTILNDISFGRHYYQIALLLRESLFINAMLWNIESWYNVTENEIDELEKIDRILLKKILNVPISTPSTLLYLELGVLNIKTIIQGRRIIYLRYIMTRNEDDLLQRFFRAQCRKPSVNDWSETVKNDIEELDLDIEFDDIKLYKK